MQYFYLLRFNVNCTEQFVFRVFAVVSRRISWLVVRVLASKNCCAPWCSVTCRSSAMCMVESMAGRRVGIRTGLDAQTAVGRCSIVGFGRLWLEQSFVQRTVPPARSERLTLRFMPSSKGSLHVKATGTHGPTRDLFSNSFSSQGSFW